ncbi:MAG: ion transporter [Saprospiraceae bacterium]|nr:ion transporter [Saprospiraceae bacterium]
MEIKKPALRDRIHEIIFETETPAGKAFDVLLLLFIVASVVVVLLESMEIYRLRFGSYLTALEWFFTLAFTLEYLLRIYSVYKPGKYIFSFFGIIDLLAILPTYIGLLIVGSHYLVVIRALRLLRIFRVFKLVNFLRQGQIIIESLRRSVPKITVFFFFILIVVTIIGSIMHVLEGGFNAGFSSIPKSIYWAIVTLTTVGYGDITPQSEIGRFLSAFVMVLGYSIIAVPTGIIASDLVRMPSGKEEVSNQSCRYCSSEGHDPDAIFCKYCGERLNP